MTVSRMLVVLLMMVAVGVAIVAIRGESAKASNRVQYLHGRQVALEQELWAKEMELARLRGPDAIRRRASELGLDLVPPNAETRPDGARTPSAGDAADRPAD